MSLVFFALVVLFAAAFAFLNGFRDASSAVALAVRTRALTPTVAVLLALSNDWSLRRLGARRHDGRDHG